MDNDLPNMDNDLPNMDNDSESLELDSPEGSPSASPNLNKDLENPINQELLHTPHGHAQRTSKKLRREKATKSRTHPLAEMAKSQT
jgi:hypothetical protein